MNAPRRLLVLAGLLWCTVGVAAEPAAEAPVVEPRQSAEQDRLMSELGKLAKKGAWKGVERTWQKISALDIPAPAAAWRIAGDAARQRGDATAAHRRYLKAERIEPDSTTEAMAQYRASFGVLEVRRLDASCIQLEPAERPFDPTWSAAIDFASAELAETGRFRGLLPAGTYRVGPHTVEIAVSMKPKVVQRVAGDSDCR